MSEWPHKSFMTATRVHKLKLAYNCLFNCFCRMRRGHGSGDASAGLAYLHIAVKITFLWASVNHSCALQSPQMSTILICQNEDMYTANIHLYVTIEHVALGSAFRVPAQPMPCDAMRSDAM